MLGVNMVDDEDYALEMCSSKAAWQILPRDVEEIDLAEVGARILESGYTVRIETHLCWIFDGPAKLTLFPSGKLLVKAENPQDAHLIAKQHITEWLG